MTCNVRVGPIWSVGREDIVAQEGKAGEARQPPDVNVRTEAYSARSLRISRGRVTDRRSGADSLR